ncbi:MAG: YHS domain-containing protein [Gemmatimonadetes bacterium]|nr:YHS domain-containing protein [Gemmatimonadota bacterium]
MRDPVCGMVIEPDKAVGSMDHGGQTYYFCSTQCLREFQSSPERYTEAAAAGAGEKESRFEPGEAVERHEPPRTTLGRVTFPKFGSAGSGGAEFERLPEAHEEKEEKGPGKE